MVEDGDMPNALDRRRLKDCITDRISRAVKKIYRCQCSAEDSYVVLTNKDRQFHKLVEHLDHAFLHGLRNITNGYWVVVHDFTHKSTLTRVKHMTNVTTNLGRGRAWLYLALSDQLLESYLQCFIDNRKVVQRYYMKDGLMLDQQRLQILVSLAAGLEFITFDVDADVPYLDLATHIKSHELTTDASRNDDGLSVCSLDSSLSQDSSITTADYPSRTMASSYDSEDSMRTHEDTTSMTASMCSLGGAEEGRMDRISRLSCHQLDGLDVEVIHVKTTKKHHHHRKAKTPQTPESGYRSVMEKSGEGADAVLHHPLNGLCHSLVVSSVTKESVMVCADSDVTEALDELVDGDTDETSNHHHISSSRVNDDSACITDTRIVHDTVETAPISSEVRDQCSDVRESVKDSKDTDGKIADGSIDNDCETLSIYDTVPCNVTSGGGVQSTVNCSKRGMESSQQSIDGLDKTPKISNGSVNSTTAPVHSNEYRVDHNLMLLLMLQIFQQDDEHFIRMFRTSMGHMEGVIEPVFILMTSHALYILSRNRKRSKPFTTRATIAYKDLDYISLSLNYQLINIVCTNRRKQFWISTGDEQLSRCIVSFIDVAIRADSHSVSQLSVLTDATTQRIALCKWIAMESNKQPSDLTIACYLLVHWEVTATSLDDPLKGQRQGSLQFRWCNDVQEVRRDWSKAYFVLRQGVLYRYNSQDDCVVQQAITLNSESCHGCRRVPLVDQPHCFQISLAGGSTVQMSADCDTEVQQWLQSICEAVSVEPMEVPSRVPCCCVLANERVCMCHEDTQTGFVRMLGVATIASITSVHVDPCLPTHCILTISSDTSAPDEFTHWILYFNAIPERDLFLKCLKRMWKTHFQMALPVSSISDGTLLCRSQTGIAKILECASPSEMINQMADS